MKWTKNPVAALGAALALAVGGTAVVAAPATPHEALPRQLRALPGVSTFAEAFEALGVVALLDANEVYTVFAPTNASLELAGLTFETADDVLAYVVVGTLTLADLTSLVTDAGQVAMLETVAGTEMSISLRQEEEIVINDIAVISIPGATRPHSVLHVVEYEGAIEGVGGSN